MNTTFIYIGIMCIILIICLGVYYFIYHLSSNNFSKYQISLIDSEILFDNDYTNTFIMSTMVGNRETLAVPKLGYGLTFIWDMYVYNIAGNDKWKTGFNILKPIISMQDSPQISYHPKKNYLSIILKYRDNPFYAQFTEIKFEDVKQQKWVKYMLIIDGRIIKLYIDGELIKSIFLPSLPVIYDIKSEIILGEINNNFLGKIRNLTMFPYPLSYNEIQNI